MKLLSNACGFISVLLMAVGLIELCRPGLFGTSLSIFVLALISSVALCLGVYVFELRGRIAALEKHIGKRP
jgi:hypothetical protein